MRPKKEGSPSLRNAGSPGGPGDPDLCGGPGAADCDGAGSGRRRRSGGAGEAAGRRAGDGRFPDAVPELLRDCGGCGQTGGNHPPGRGKISHACESVGAGRAEDAGRDRRRHCQRRGPAPGIGPGLWRPVPGHSGMPQKTHAQHGGPFSRGNEGLPGGPGVCADPPGSGAAHPSGKGFQQCLLESGPLCAEGLGVPGGSGAGGAPAGGGALLLQGPLSGGAAGRRRADPGLRQTVLP